VTEVLWYTARGTGLVSLLLLGVVVGLGVATRSGRPAFGLPRFAVTAVHRGAALLAVVFVAVHVLTLLFDPYAGLGLLDLVVPFTAAASPFWYGLGAVALDLLVAVVVTSVLRARIGPRTWRAVHLLGYACWPVALGHAIGSGSDTGTTWMWVLLALSAAVVAPAIWWRLHARPGRDALAPASAPPPVTVIGGGPSSGEDHR